MSYYPSEYINEKPLTYDEIELNKEYFYNPGLGDASHIVKIIFKNKNFIRINYNYLNEDHNEDIGVNNINNDKIRYNFFNIINKGGGKCKRKSRRNKKSRQNQRKKSRQSRRR